jgi:hypothetical protein
LKNKKNSISPKKISNNGTNNLDSTSDTGSGVSLIENYTKPEPKPLSKFEKLEKKLSFQKLKNNKSDDNTLLNNEEKNENENIFEKNDIIFFGVFFIGLFFSFFQYGVFGFFVLFFVGCLLIYFHYFMN